MSEMNADLKAQLAKYMKDNGEYDIEALARDERITEDDPFGLNSTFSTWFAGDEESPVQDSELMAAAKAYNLEVANAKIEAIAAKPDSEITTEEWQKLVAAKKAEAIDLPGDDHTSGYTTYRKVETTPKTRKVTVTPADGDFEIEEIRFRIEFDYTKWSTAVTLQTDGTDDIELPQFEDIRTLLEECEWDKSDEEFTFEIAESDIQKARDFIEAWKAADEGWEHPVIS